MSAERFSRRYGHGPQESEVSIRDDAPEEVRAAILKIAEGELGLSPSFLRDVLCTVLRRLPDRSNWSEYPNVWEECQYLINNCPWYRVYDFVEALYRSLAESQEPERADRWASLINEYFAEAGVGWRLVDGILESRGPEAFEVAVDTARRSLNEAGLATARQEIHEVLRDLSRRPDPDLTGAVQHAIAGLECTAREVVGDQRATLGDVLKRYRNFFRSRSTKSFRKCGDMHLRLRVISARGEHPNGPRPNSLLESQLPPLITLRQRSVVHDSGGKAQAAEQQASELL